MAVNETTSRLIIDGNPDGLVAAMQKSVSSVKDGTGQMVSHFNQIGGSINGVIGIFGTLGGIIAGGAAFKSIVSATTTWDLETGKLAKTLGATTQEASIFKVALHSVGVDQEVAAAAGLRMAKTLNSNSDAFKAIGVDIEGMRKAGKSNIEMMVATVQALSEYKGGLDRNQMALSIFSRSWGEVQQLMKLTPSVMQHAREEAERLHLIVGPEGVAKSAEYKKSLRELSLVQESLKIQIGHELIPVLTQLGVAFGEAGVAASSGFGSGLRYVLRQIAETKLQYTIALKELGVMMDGGPLGSNWFTKKGRAEITAEIDALEQMYQYSMEKIADRYGNPNRAVTPSALHGKSAPPKPPAAPSGPDPSEQLYKRYGTELNTLNRQIAESNPYLTEQDKAMEGVYATVLKLSEEMPEYIKSWNAYGAAMEQNILLAKKLKDEQERLQIDKEMERDELVNGLMKSDDYLNAVGKISESQQTRLDDSAMLSDWAARREASLKAQSDAEAQFRTLTDPAADQELQQALARINQEEEAWMQSWAMQTDSFEEHERRKTLIQKFYEEQRGKAAQDSSLRARQSDLQNTQLMLTSASNFLTGLNSLTKGKSKELQVAMKAVNMGMAIANTALGVTKALAEVPYPYDMVVAGLIAATGAAQVATIASSDSAGSGGAVSFSGSGGGGYSAGSFPSDRMISSPVSQSAQPQGNLTVILNNPIGEKKWFEDNIPGIFQDFRSRNVNTGVVYQ